MRIAASPLTISVVALSAAVLSACGGKGNPVQPKVATQLVVAAGDGQTSGVGTALPTRITVTTRDAQGPVGGIAVSATTESQGGGSVSPSSVTTAANGNAEITWTLGSKVGTQTLTLSSTGVPSVTVSATGLVGAASILFPVSDAFQFTVVSRPVTLVPSVRVTDAFGNPIPGVPVTFDAPVAGSVLTGTDATTNDQGLATLGSWTIGPDALSYSVRARILSGPAAGQGTVFEARGIPATAIAVAGSGQTANAGTAVGVAPAIFAARPDGSPLPGVGVTFAVGAGGGQVQGPAAVTGIDGIARASGWILGAAPGANRIDAQLLGLPLVAFTATGVQGVPTSAVAATSTSQSGFFGNFVANPPAVVVTDAQSKPVAGATVQFELAQADGQVVGASQLTDFMGRAILSGWRLGTGTSQAVRALVASFPPIIFSASVSAPPVSTFKLEVRYRSAADGCAQCQTPTAAQTIAFDQAVTRWKQIIIEGAQPYPINEPAVPSLFPAMNETVDGLVIFASLVPIDGVNNILGSAGPIIVRDDHGYQPAMGIMRFDIADLAALEGRNQLNDVILHEMGHVLGFGTMWNFDPGPPFVSPTNPPNALLLGAGTGDPVFIGPSTRAAFLGAVAIGRTFTGVPTPVENSFGPGTRDSHWRESILGTELMTGFISGTGTQNPLSAFSITSFRDLGYVVNDAVADPFTFLASLQASQALPIPSFGGGFQLIEEPIAQPITVIDRRGRTVARVPRQ